MDDPDRIAEIRARDARLARPDAGVTMTQADADRRTLLRLLDETAARLPIGELGLDPRTHRILAASDVCHVGELLRLTEEQLGDLRNMGQKSTENVKDRLRAEFGLALRPAADR